MGSSGICEDQLHKLHQLLFSSKKPFKDIEIPPRKLFSKSKISHHHHHHLQEDSINMNSLDNLHNFVPYNSNSDSDPDSPDSGGPYASDHFRMYEFKVRRCTRSRSHDWTDCPFAHPGEKARRRDPRRHHYSGTVCSDFRRGGCSRGDDCEFAHGVFECWLHPSRYRTEPCKDGKNCKRKVCFFAHSSRQLRVLPEISSSAGGGGCERNYTSTLSPTSFDSVSQNHCCLFCHPVASSPTSTLLGMSHMSRSPSLSPPLSPVKHRSVSGFSPISRYSERIGNPDYSCGQSKLCQGAASYKDVLTELMTSLDSVNLSEVPSPVSNNGNCRNVNVSWVNDACEDYQQELILSPSTPKPLSGSGNFFKKIDSVSPEMKISDNNGGQANCSDPDLGWVNELLM